jgi:hypothetical protein
MMLHFVSVYEETSAVTAVFQAIPAIGEMDCRALARNARIDQLQMISLGASSNVKGKLVHRHTASGFIWENNFEDCFCV